MAQIKADEITELLRQQIENYDQRITVDEVGTVISRVTELRVSTAWTRSWPVSSSSSRTALRASR
jgi:hypothetical protein